MNEENPWIEFKGEFPDENAYYLIRIVVSIPDSDIQRAIYRVVTKSTFMNQVSRCIVDSTFTYKITHYMEIPKL